MGTKGKKSKKGEAENQWGEVKTASYTVKLTPTGKRLLDEKLKQWDYSFAEFLERLARGSIKPVNFNSIASVLGAGNLVEIAEESGIALKRLEELRDGAEPRLPELSLLETPLEIALEQLMFWHTRDFKQHKQINGST